jgi:hypothetical protein
MAVLPSTLATRSHTSIATFFDARTWPSSAHNSHSVDILHCKVTELDWVALVFS